MIILLISDSVSCLFSNWRVHYVPLFSVQVIEKFAVSLHRVQLGNRRLVPENSEVKFYTLAHTHAHTSTTCHFPQLQSTNQT